MIRSVVMQQEKTGLRQIKAVASVCIEYGRMAIAITPLQATEFDDALVLARLGYARVDAVVWRDQLQTIVEDERQGGALLARDHAGRACGLMLYRIIAIPDHRPTLEVARLVAFDLMDPRLIADALIEEAVRLARLQDCDTLRLVRPLDTPSDTSALVLASGIADLHSVF